jgi:hypothetical protein
MPFKTERDIAKLTLPEGQTDVHHSDLTTRGLSVRPQRGRKTYVVHYAIGGRWRRVTLGKVGALYLKKAREMVSEIVARALLGGDPSAPRDRAK